VTARFLSPNELIAAPGYGRAIAQYGASAAARTKHLIWLVAGARYSRYQPAIDATFVFAA
jgi:hypothetical protein